MNRSILSATYNSRFISKCGEKSLIVRSDKIDNCGRDDIDFLFCSGIRNIIDLRNLQNKKLNRFLNDYGMNIFNFPLPAHVDCEQWVSNCDIAFLDYYIFLIMRYSTIKTILQGFLTLSGGALLNCSLGRDRTGVVCFIIEIIAGFSKEFIVEDMAETDNNLLSQVNNEDLIEELNYEQARERASLLYDWFFKKYQSIENYLSQIGFKKHEVNALKIKMRFLSNGND